MSIETKRYIARAIIMHLDGDTELFHQLVGQALELREREVHLYMPLAEMARVKVS
jgi:hypothetical protein